MTRTEFLTAFLKKSMCPVLLAAFLYNVFFHLAVQYGTVNYMYLLMLCGIPFGIRFMFLLPVFFGNLGAGIAMTCFNIAIGALIGGFVLLWKLAVAVWYNKLTVFVRRACRGVVIAIINENLQALFRFLRFGIENGDRCPVGII